VVQGTEPFDTQKLHLMSPSADLFDPPINGGGNSAISSKNFGPDYAVADDTSST